MTTKEIALSLAALIEHHLATLAGIVGALVVILAGAPKLKRAWSKLRRLSMAVWETNVGRDEVPPNPITGESGRPAVLPVGARISRVEEATSRTTELQKRTNELQEQGNDLMRQMVDLIRGQQHQDTRLDEHDHLFGEHDQRIGALESAQVERAVTRAESLTHLTMLAKAQGVDPAEILPESARDDGGDQ